MMQRSILAVRLVIPVVMLALAGAAMCQGDQPAPALPPGPPANETPSQAVNRILVLTDDEKDSLNTAQSRRTGYEESAFYTLLNRASQLPELPQEQFADLAKPDYSSLMLTPDAYAGRPIRMNVLVFSVIKQVSGEGGLDPALLWPVGQERWLITCYDADSKYDTVTKKGQHGLLIVSTVDPTPLLPQTHTDEDVALKKYPPRLAKLTIAGVFYKLFEDMELGDPEHPELSRKETFPLIIAWQIVSRRSDPRSNVPTALTVVIVFAIVAFLAAFYFLVRYVRRTGRQSMEARRALWPDRYRALRDTAQDHLPADETEDANDVDPQLKAAVEDWRRDHPEDEPDG